MVQESFWEANSHSAGKFPNEGLLACSKESTTGMHLETD